MLQDRLTSLAVLHVHRDIDIDIDMRSFTLGNLVILTLATDIKFKYKINNANYYVF